MTEYVILEDHVNGEWFHAIPLTADGLLDVENEVGPFESEEAAEAYAQEHWAR